MAVRCVDRCSASPVIREIQTSNRRRCPTHITQGAAPHTCQNGCYQEEEISVGRDVERKEPHTRLAGMQTGTATVGNSREGPPKTKSGANIRHRNSTSGYLNEESENVNLERYVQLCLQQHYLRSHLMEEALVSVHRHTHTGLLLSHKKDEISPFAMTWVDREGVMLSEVSQRQAPCDLAHCGVSDAKQMSKQ